jgi:hypothetical protein
VTRHPSPHRDDRLHALFACPLIHQIANDVGNLGRRTRRHPIAMHLAFGAMSRLYGSANCLDSEITNPHQWAKIVELYNTHAELHDGAVINAVGVPLIADTYRHVRDQLGRHLDDLSDSFTRHAVEIAHAVGLLRVDGPGSRTRPHPSRTIYGDGTIVRPIYRPTNNGRTDPDAAQHSRHDGQIWGNNLVTIATRGSNPNQRVILAVGRVDTPGHEAATAVELIRHVHSHAGDGIQAVVYDGAFRGVHINTIMSDLGLIAVNKVHAATANDTDRTYRQLPLGQWTHTVRGRTCTHTIVAHQGHAHDSTLDDSGNLVLSEPLQRHQVRRYERGKSGWRFTLGVHVPCPKAPFTAWISPHPQPGDTGYGRPDQFRLLAELDPHFQILYGLRNDSEAINAAYKRTLVADRASALGWKRQVLDLMSWGLLTNTLAWQLHADHPARATQHAASSKP